LWELSDVVATEVEGHRPIVGKVEEQTGRAEPGGNFVDVPDLGERELRDHAAGIWGTSAPEDEQPSGRGDQRAIAAVGRVDPLANLALRTFGSFGGGREGQDRDHVLPGAQPIRDGVDHRVTLLGASRP
jgi:hypothetical protein